MVLKIIKGLFCILLSVFSSGLYSQDITLDSDKVYSKGIILFRNGSVEPGEIREYEGNFFIRNDEAGRVIAQRDIIDVVSEDYYSKIKATTAMKSMYESLLYFNSSRQYEWNGFDSPDSHEDLYVKIVKIGLLALTGLSYYSAFQANQALGSSYEGFNSQQKARFEQRYGYYLLSSSLTLGFFGYSTVNAYIRFGRNNSGENLGIHERSIPGRGSSKFKEDDNKRLSISFTSHL